MGIQQSVAHYKGPGDYNDHPVGIAVNNNGDVYLAGHSYTTNWSIISTLKYAYSEFGDDNHPLPDKYELSQDFPNPFNNSITIRYTLPQPCFVTLQIFNLLGQKVTTLVDTPQPPGDYKLPWQPDNLSSGVYVYRLQAGGFEETKKMLLLR